jgi:paraquat-inducible protein A
MQEQSSKPFTMASIARGEYALVGPGLVLVAALFPVVLFVPLLTTRIWFLSYNDIVLARVAYDLVKVDMFLFIVVFIFGMLLPAAKILFSVFYWYRLDFRLSNSYIEKLSYLNKLSMLDIMLLAVFIVAFKGLGAGTVEIRYGLYLYLFLVVASLILNVSMSAAMREVQNGLAERI